ncbi:MAG TPA: sulfatase [Thermoanaerobaculia bacterium]
MPGSLTRRDALQLLAGAAAGARLSRRAMGQTLRRPPNIVVFLTDDQRQDAMSVAGNRILKTPNMDRIAAEGVRFTESFVTNSLCGPSRASFLTGLYSHAHGVISNADPPAFGHQKGIEGHPTYPELLQKAGYRTAVVGKWHLRGTPQGFDHWVIFPWQGEYHDPEMIANGATIRLRGHSEDVTGDQALAFLRSLPKEERPFCLLVHFKAPHRSWEPPARFLETFADTVIPTPRTFEDRLAGRPEAVRRATMAIADMGDFEKRGVPRDLPVEERKRRNLQELVKNYYRVLLAVDENVGRILDELEKRGLTRDTVVVYSSDNGFFLGEHGLFDKRLMYEPSIRVPMLLRYPARVAPRVENAHMVLNVDLAPTLLELAGVAAPSGLHGRSFVPLLEGRPVHWRDDFLYEYYEYPAAHCVRKNRGVRDGRWKLIHFWQPPEEWELYDLRSDPDETRNLVSEPGHAETVRRLRRRLEELRRELGDAEPASLEPPPPCDLPA